MEDNPFSAIVEAFRDEPASSALPAPFVYGDVKSAPTVEQPGRALIVTVHGIDKGVDALRKSADAGGFAAGDRLLLLPIDEAQRYIILCKVVGA